jgi:hypothetical protein
VKSIRHFLAVIGSTTSIAYATTSLTATPVLAASLDEKLNTWSSIGNVTLSSSEALLSTGNGSANSDQLFSFLKLLSTFGEPSLYSGSAIQKSFEVKAGSTLNFDWDLSSSDDTYAFLQINDQISALTDKSDNANPLLIVGGVVTVGFIIAQLLKDSKDSSPSTLKDSSPSTLKDSSPSTLKVSNVSVQAPYQAVPFPALLPGAIAFGLGVLRKRNMTQSE